MFSNKARTGTRVPANTQAPPTRPGTRSTAAHAVQSTTVLLRAPLRMGRRLPPDIVTIEARTSGQRFGLATARTRKPRDRGQVPFLTDADQRH